MPTAAYRHNITSLEMVAHLRKRLKAEGLRDVQVTLNRGSRDVYIMIQAKGLTYRPLAKAEMEIIVPLLKINRLVYNWGGRIEELDDSDIRDRGPFSVWYGPNDKARIAINKAMANVGYCQQCNQQRHHVAYANGRQLCPTCIA